MENTFFYIKIYNFVLKKWISFNKILFQFRMFFFYVNILLHLDQVNYYRY